VVVGTAAEISHAFLERYAWTIDFDLRQYLFHSPTLQRA
jgi:hypothetical protein